MPRRALTILPVLALLWACGGDFKPVLVDDTGQADGSTDDGGTDDGTTDDGTTDGGGTDGGDDAGGTDDGGADSGATGEAVDYCHVQYPCGMTVAAGATSESVYVWVYEDGRTVGEGAGAGIEVELGVGADGSDPADGGWDWSAASWFDDKDGLTPGDLSNDEFAGTLTAPGTAGSYDYAARVRVDGGPWAFCDLAENDGNGGSGAGTDDGYDPADAGVLTVE